MERKYSATPPTAIAPVPAPATVVPPVRSAPPEPRVDDSVVLDLRSFVARHYRVLLAAVAAGLVLAYAFSKSETPAYRATATIEVQDLNENFLNLGEVSQHSAIPRSADGSDLQTQMRILTSGSLLTRVLTQMPEEVIPPPRGARAFAAKLRKAAEATEPSEAETLENVRRNLQVRDTRQSRIVDLSYESPDPAYAAAFVNRLANVYIENSIESRMEISRGTSQWMERQLAELRAKLSAAEQRLHDYARQSGLVVTGDQLRPDEDKLRQIQANLTEAQENRMVQQARMETVLAAPLDSIEAPLNSSLHDQQTRLADLRRQRADLLAVFTPDFDGVKRLQAQIESLEKSVQGETAALVQGARNNYEDAVRRERLLEEGYRQQVGEVSEQAGIAIQYEILKHEADTNRELYDSMLQRAAEAKVASAMRASNARIVDVAKPPERPFRPATILNLAWGATAGLLFGLVVVTARGHSEKVRRPGEIAHRLRLPELGAVPVIKAPIAGRLSSEAGLLRGGRLSAAGRVALQTWNDRNSAAALSYRAVLTSILFSQEAWRTAQVVVVTSVAEGEGKTTLAANLAASLAQVKQRVLLIDGSRDGGLQKLFGLSQDYGLLDVLESPGELRDLLPYVTQPTSIPHVSLVVAASAGASALELLYTDGMSVLLEQMRRVYDVILVDAPAMNERSDARVFGRMADGVVLVVGAGDTKMEAVRSAAARLREDATVLLGTVLNRVAS